ISDACNGSGTCLGTPKDCSDGSVCTNDSCVEPSGNCSYATSGACNITGLIQYSRDQTSSTEPSTKPVPSEPVQRTSTLEPTESSTTDTNGQYSFTNEGGNVSLTPQGLLLTNDNECRAAITATDAAAIAQSAVLLTVLTSNQAVAGDVSNNGTVSAFDAALVSQRAVAASCKDYHFPVRDAHSSDWAFRPLSKSFTPLHGGEDYNFLGVLYGDVTGNWVSFGAFAQPAVTIDPRVEIPGVLAGAADAGTAASEPVTVRAT